MFCELDQVVSPIGFARLGGTAAKRTRLDRPVPPARFATMVEHSTSVYEARSAWLARTSQELAKDHAENQSVPTAAANINLYNADHLKSAIALCATAWLMGQEFCVLSSVLEFWLMVYGFVFEKFPFGEGNMESPVIYSSPRFLGLTLSTEN